MASIIREASGRRRIEFVVPGRPRQRIRLGKVNQRTAEGIKTKIESLVSAAASG